jgi:bla regulator protein BlaR1
VGQAINRRAALASCPTIRLVSSAAKLEPGVFGIFRPVLWLPAGIGDRLDDAELEAILAHELCHIRRRDNLLASIHMAVEAIFWFHPLVWWLGSRLEEERERACDEEVVRMGGEPQIYAESILKVCEFYLASPVACAAGVTGGELKKRIEGIMTNRFTRKLSYGKKLLLASAAIVVIGGPIIVGLLNPTRGRAQARPEFDVASVKASPAGNANGVRIRTPLSGGPGTSSPGIARCTNCTLSDLVLKAYDIEQYQLLGPTWLDAQLLITAKVPDGATPEQFRLMLQNLLAERFKLAFHREKRDVPGYALVVAKDGVRLKETAGGEPPQEPQANRPRTTVGKDGFIVVPPGYTANGVFSFRNGDSLFSTVAGKASMDQLALELTRELRQPVADATGLKGKYDFVMYWALELPEPPSAPGGEPPVASTPLPTLSEALHKLGLKLEQRKVPADVLMVDHIEKAPTEN